MKFDITRRYPLKDFGDKWKDCYLDFRPFTIRELLKEFPEFAGLNPESDKEKIAEASASTLKILREHFVGGKGVVEGEVVDIKAGDLGELPAEILTGALRFISKRPGAPESPPSGTPSKE